MDRKDGYVRRGRVRRETRSEKGRVIRVGQKVG